LDLSFFLAVTLSAALPPAFFLPITAFVTSFPPLAFSPPSRKVLPAYSFPVYLVPAFNDLAPFTFCLFTAAKRFPDYPLFFVAIAVMALLLPCFYLL